MRAGAGPADIPREQYEVIVVDDGSTDGTARAARAAGAGRVLTTSHPGPAAARNAGGRAAQAPIILFTDADCEPSPTWLERMTAPFADPQIAGTKGTYRTRQQALIPRLVQLEYEFRYERMKRFPRIDFIDTYSAAYRRDLLLAAGGFDETYPPSSAEDVDLAFRLARAGHTFQFVPAAWVYHQHPTSLVTYLYRKGRYGFWRGRLYLRYPDKVRGDAHTDPILKPQFALAGLLAALSAGAVLYPPLTWAAGAVLAALLATTIPFVRWAWQRDRAVALAWPPITLLRLLVQGAALAAGLLWHGLISRPGRRE